jgi:Fe-S-cluster-containing dehydrogenase component
MFRGVGRTISRFIPELEDTAHDPDPCPEPGRRQRSIRIIERLEQARRRAIPDMPMPFTGREIDASRCDICGGSPMCVSFCPTDALEFFADRGGVAITFAASRCIGCELCQGACHKAAVSSFPLQSGQLEELWSARTLASFEAHECDGCGRVSAVTLGGLCQDCQQRERKLGWDVV